MKQTAAAVGFSAGFPGTRVSNPQAGGRRAAGVWTRSAWRGSTRGARAGSPASDATPSTWPSGSPRRAGAGPPRRCAGSPVRRWRRIPIWTGSCRAYSPGCAMAEVFDAHRHLGILPAYPFYGGPPVRPDIGARGTIRQLVADLDTEGTARALVIPNYGVPDPAAAFSFNELCVEAAATDDRIRCGLWVSPRPADASRTAAALALAGEPGVRALKLSFLLGGRASDPECRPLLDEIFATAQRD